MLSAELTIENIGYEQTLTRLFPMLYYQVITTQSSHFLLRLIEKLGPDALPVCREILSRLSQEDKDQLVVLGLNAYSEPLAQAIREGLAADSLGKYLDVASVGAQKRGSRMILLAEGITVDYAGLLGEERVQRKVNEQLGNLSAFAQIAAKAAISAAPEFLESRGIALLQRPENRQRLLRLAQPILDSRGFVMTLTDLRMTQSEKTASTPVNAAFCMSRDLEDHILTALADYLRAGL